MRKFLNVFVPLLMVCAIIFSIGWYLMEYDPEFTRDMLLLQARRLDEQNNHSAAVWFYNLAYRQSDNDDSVAIELAQQYKSIGNYTKAESTLSDAIADGGSTALYVALCQTYVEQNKLIDAVTMLNNIADPGMKAQLDSMRPAAPVATPVSGKYSEYITVSFTPGEERLYVSTDGIYPSVKDDAYTSPITLPGGETTVLALAINEENLVSPLATFTYTIHGVIEEVSFTDAAVERALRETLNITDERVIYSNELWAITEFTVPSDAQSCEDLKWLPYLNKLTISGALVPDLMPISQLTGITELNITDTVVASKDLPIIASLPKLTSLTLANCQLSNISNLAGAKNLTYLDLSNNTIRDLRALAGMNKLETLWLANNAVISLEAISGMTSLRLLDVSYNSLTTTAHVAGLYNLTWLNVSSNGLMTLEGIDKLTNLIAFYASYNNLVDIDILAGCTKLEQLNVSNNTLLNIDVVAGMLVLKELNFAYNEVTALPAFNKGCALWGIAGDYNKLDSLEQLSYLRNLSYVFMDYNEEISSVACLERCPLLLKVSVYGTDVSEVSMLTDQGIIVYYDPT